MCLALLLAGCSATGSTASAGPSRSATGPATGSVTVFAAASLTESFTRLGVDFEKANPGVKVDFNFAASSALAEQINQGAPADVFASASATNMDQVVSAGGAKNPRTFARNMLQIAVPASNPANIRTLADLASPGVKVAVCQPEVPCGVLADRVFRNANLDVTPVTLEADVKSTVAKVQLGEVDAGLVYVSDVRAAGDKVSGIPIKASVNASTNYPIAALADAPNAAAAARFVRYVCSGHGQAVLAGDGFERP